MAEEKKVMGRPKSDNPKKHAVTIRLTETEYKKLKTYAEKNSQTITTVVLEGLKGILEK